MLCEFDILVWYVFFGVCKFYNNVRLVELVVYYVFELELLNVSVYVILLNIYV